MVILQRPDFRDQHYERTGGPRPHFYGSPPDCPRPEKTVANVTDVNDFEAIHEQKRTNVSKKENASMRSNEPALQDAHLRKRPNKESETDRRSVSLLKTESGDTNELIPNKPNTFVNTSMTNEQVILTEALALFEKYKPQQGKDARIPNDDYFEMYRRVETALHNQEVTNKTNQETSPVGSNGEKNGPTIHMLNTCDTNAGKLFQEILRQKLGDMVNVKELTREADVEESDKRNVLIVIGNIDEYSSAQETVDKCLDYVKEDMYGRLIVIVLHVKREKQLPRTDTRAQLIANKYSQVGTILDMGYLPAEGIYSCSKNNTALRKIYDFLKLNASVHVEHQNKRPRKEHAASGHDVNPKAKESHSNRQKAKEETKQDAYLLSTPNTTPVAREFAEKLIVVIEKQGVCLHKIENVDANELDPDLPIFMVCNNNSRIEADLESCLQDISGKVYRRIVLVVLHVCRREKLSKTYTKQYLQTSSSVEKYEDIPKIVDIAYIKDDGIYPCKMNEDAFKELKDFHAYRHTKHGPSHEN